LLLGIAIGASIVVHSGLALASYMRDLTVTPAQPTCRAGESIQLEAFARSAWNSTLHVTNSATWAVSDPKIASHAGGGFMRCIAEGDVSITTTYLNRSSTFQLKVDPALVMVDIPKEEPPPPPPPEPEPDPQPAAAPQAPPEAKATPEPPPPPAAKAGNLLTAPDDDNKQGDDPVSFVTDPNGEEYGSGNVQKGGTADFGKAGSVASGVPNGTGTGQAKQGPPAPPPGPAIVPTTDLSRKPSLPAGYQCKNFPADADDDVANVQVLVTVKPSGEVQSVSVMDEKPKGQGFGKAARNCVTAVKLTPGLDKAGTAVLTTVAISVHFSR
jgi:hypothetical protein